MSKMIEELQEGISRLSAENARLKELTTELLDENEMLREILKLYRRRKGSEKWGGGKVDDTTMGSFSNSST